MTTNHAKADFIAGKPMPIDALRELIAYDHDTGTMVWRARGAHWIESDFWRESWNAKNFGNPALQATKLQGGKSRGGKLFGRMLTAAQVAYALAYGEYAPEAVGFHNGDHCDYRKENMFAISYRELNIRSARARGNSTGLPFGVKNVEGRFSARFRGDYLGTYARPEQAEAAVTGARRAAGEI